MTTTQKIVEDTTILALSRLAMLITPVLISVVGFLFYLWIDGIGQSAKTAAETAAVRESVVAEANRRFGATLRA